jgi:hypothetical protein
MEVGSVMEKYTFRTECFFDCGPATLLLAEMGIKEYYFKTIGDYMMGSFTFESKKSLMELKYEMYHICEENFEDLHRCYQTLAVGENYEENWFEVEQPYEDIMYFEYMQNLTNTERLVIFGLLQHVMRDSNMIVLNRKIKELIASQCSMNIITIENILLRLREKDIIKKTDKVGIFILNTPPPIQKKSIPLDFF